jgi:hypothetical protein
MHPIPRGFLIGVAVASIQVGCEALTLSAPAALTPAPTPTLFGPPPTTTTPMGEKIGGCFIAMAGKSCLKWQI